jgi:hypothetical protein
MKLFTLCISLLALLRVNPCLGADFNSLKIPSVTVTVSDFTLDYSPVSKEVALKPAAGGTIRAGTSDANGVVTFARVTPGLYTLTIAGIGMDPLTIQVPNSTNALAANALVISAWTPPSGASYAGATANLRAWSLLSSSAKEDQSANLDAWSAIATSTKQPASDNLTNWSALATSAKQATLTATSSIVGTNANIGGTANATNGFLRGSFTGITTTNTFYSVAADLLSTVTNVVVVQGGIITGWTVTP